jgi:glyoxylase-like metal-dependent hydrolase (beta-lactamase superfamily II)
MLTACHILDTGCCLASEHHMIAGGARNTIECHALAILLHHQTAGWILFDTGYHPRMFDATERWPYRLYRRLTPLRIAPEKAAIAQLPRFGLRPDDIGTVILSHFHADHLSGLKDFPNARILASADGYAAVNGRKGWSALRRAFLPDLMPPDFAARFQPVLRFDGLELPPLGPTHDLYGDGSLLLVPLPGHARGQMGLLAVLPGRPHFFIADAAYLTRSIRENRPPHPLTMVTFADNGAGVRATLSKLHMLHTSRPEVVFVPTHCPEAFARFVEGGEEAK